MILQKDETEIKKVNITDPGTTSYSFRGLEKNTNYTVKLFSRNFVFEGDPTVWNIKTKFEGEESKVISYAVTFRKCYLIYQALFGLSFFFFYFLMFTFQNLQYESATRTAAT